MARPLSLPEPSDQRLQTSPLRLVVCQVRHSRTVSVSDAGLLIDAQQRLGDRYPEASAFEQQEVLFMAGPAGANANTRQGQQGWQLKSEDGAWTVTLQTDFFSLETSAYVDWSDFRGRLAELVDSVVEIYKPKLEQRLGLRYVDEIERRDLHTPADWRGWIDDAILGPLADESLGPSVRVAQQIIEFEGPDGTRALLRHGCEMAPNERQGSTYRLDHDCFRQRSRPIDRAAILGTAEDLHRLALQLFQKAVTHEMYEHLRIGGVAE